MDHAGAAMKRSISDCWAGALATIAAFSCSGSEPALHQELTQSTSDSPRSRVDIPVAGADEWQFNKHCRLVVADEGETVDLEIRLVGTSAVVYSEVPDFPVGKISKYDYYVKGYCSPRMVYDASSPSQLRRVSECNFVVASLEKLGRRFLSGEKSTDALSAFTRVDGILQVNANVADAEAVSLTVGSVIDGLDLNISNMKRYGRSDTYGGGVVSVAGSVGTVIKDLYDLRADCGKGRL